MEQTRQNNAPASAQFNLERRNALCHHYVLKDRVLMRIRPATADAADYSRKALTNSLAGCCWISAGPANCSTRPWLRSATRSASAKASS
jgi:hypothetical protein